MEHIVGISLALLVCGAAAGLGMDRERVFYPAVLIAVAMAVNGLMDGFHHHVVHNVGVPQVWPGFCMTFDLTAASFVAWVMMARARGQRGQQSFGPG